MNIHLLGQAPAKINLYLHITGRRADGYHLLESLFAPIGLYDDIELKVSRVESTGPCTVLVERSGDLLHIPPEKDLTVRAAHAWFTEAQPPGHWQVDIQVTKRIPDQAGLGGGSSDAATVLKLLNQAATPSGSAPSIPTKPLELNQLHQVALRLGADVPFFLGTGTALVEGIGEQITPFHPIEASLIVYKPPQSCPTAQIFSDPQLTRDSKPVRIAVFDSASPARQGQKPKNSAHHKALFDYLRLNTSNVMQQVVEHRFPEWSSQFEAFSSLANTHCALLSRMSGSGSSMFAAFASPSERNQAFEAMKQNSVLQTGQLFAAEVCG